MATERNNASNNIVARVNYIDSRLRQEEYSQPATEPTGKSATSLSRGSVQTEHLGSINEINTVGDLRISATGVVTITGGLVVDGETVGIGTGGVIYQPDEPVDLTEDDEGTLWIDPSDNNALHYWGGVSFSPVSDPRVETVVADVVNIAEDLAAASAAVDVVRNDVNTLETVTLPALNDTLTSTQSTLDQIQNGTLPALQEAIEIAQASADSTVKVWFEDDLGAGVKPTLNDGSDLGDLYYRSDGQVERWLGSTKGGWILVQDTVLAETITALRDAEAQINTLNTVTLPDLQTALDAAEAQVAQHTTDLASLDGRLDTNEIDLSNAQAALATAQGQINTLNTTTLPNLQSELDAAEALVSQHTTDITGLDTRVDSAETNISTATANIATAQGQINTLNNTTIPNLNTALSNAQGQINTLNNTTLPALTGRMSSAETALTSAQGSINTLNNTTIPNLNTAINTAQGQVNTLKDTTVPALTTRVSTAEGEITTAKTNIANAQGAINVLNTTTIPNLNTAIDNAQSDVDELNTSILPNLESVLSEKIAQVSESKGATWSQDTAPPSGDVFTWLGAEHASASTRSLNDTLVATNLATNPSFETAGGAVTVRTNLFLEPNPTTATMWPASRLDPVTFSTESGVAYVRGVVNALGTSYYNLTTAANRVPAVPGDVHTYSADLRMGSGTTGMYIRTYYWNASGGLISGAQTDGAVVTGSAWERASVTSTAPAGTAYVSAYILGAAGTPVGGTMDVRRMMVEKTATAGTYFDGSTPAAGDFTYAWTSTANNSTSIQQGVRVANLDGGLAHLLRSSEWALSGTKSMRMRSLYATPGSAYAEIARTGMERGLVAGKTYTMSATVRVTEPYQTNYARPNMQIVCVGGANQPSVISTTTPDVGEHRHTITFTVPTTGSWYLRLYHSGQQGTPDIWWDDLIITEGSAPVSYFDGSFADSRQNDLWIKTLNGENTPYRWDGVTPWVVSTDKAASDANTLVQGWRTTGQTTIDGGKITADSVTAGQIQANAITASELAADAVYANAIQANAVVAGKIATDAVTANTIVAGAVTAGKIAANAVTANTVEAGAITAGKIATNAIVADNIQANAITTAKINAGAVTATEIAANAVTAVKIDALAITAGKIAADAVTATTIAANAVVAGKIATDAVTSNTIVANAITTAKINAGAVTATEIATNAVTADKVLAGAIVAGKIAADAVTATTIAANAVVAGKIATDAVTANTIAANAVVAGKINADAVTATTIASGAVIAGKIAADAVTASTILAGAVTAGKIATDAVTANTIAAGAVTVGKIDANAVTATTIASDAVTAGKIAANAVTAREVLANSIGTEKLLVGDFTNYFNDPTFSATTGYSTWAKVVTSSIPGIEKNGTATQNGAYIASTQFPVVPGEKFSVAATRETVSGTITAAAGQVSIYFQALNAAGTQISVSKVLDLAALGVNRTTEIAPYTVPANAVSVRVGFYTESTVPATVRVRISDVQIRRLVGATSIESGAITTAKVAANAITANELAVGAITASKAIIADGAIKTAQIADAQITNAKIQGLSADKINAGTISADRIGANTITASKLLLVADNVFPDPLVADVNGWPTAGNSKRVVDASFPGGSALELITSASQAGAYYSNGAELVRLEPGVEYRVRVLVNVAGSPTTTTVSLVQSSRTAAGASTYALAELIPAGAVAGRRVYEATLVSDSNAATLSALGFFTYGTNQAGATFRIGDISIQRKAGAELIVDGSITANAISGQSVTAIALRTGSITAEHMGVGSVTASAIGVGAVTADSIAADAVTAANIKAGSILGENIAANTIQVKHLDAGIGGQLDLTANDRVNFVLGEANKGIGAAAAVASNVSTMQTYYSFTPTGATITTPSSPYSLALTSDGIAIQNSAHIDNTLVGGVPVNPNGVVSYWNADVMHVDQFVGEIVHLGNHQIRKTASGTIVKAIG